MQATIYKHHTFVTLYRVCKAAGIVSEDQKPICPIDAKGRFILPVKDFEGQYVKVR